MSLVPEDRCFRIDCGAERLIFDGFLDRLENVISLLKYSVLNYIYMFLGSLDISASMTLKFILNCIDCFKHIVFW